MSEMGFTTRHLIVHGVDTEAMLDFRCKGLGATLESGGWALGPFASREVD